MAQAPPSSPLGSPPRRRRTDSPARAPGPAALRRVFHLHGRLAAGRPVNAVALARELGVNTRTIKRDIELIRGLGAPVAWDKARGTYVYTTACDLLPLLRLDADEALALLLAHRTFHAWHGSPLGRALHAALEKLSGVVRDTISVPADSLRDCIFEPADDPAADAEHRHFAQLLEAIRRRRVVRFTYRKPTPRARPETREVHPLHLAFLDHRWTLIAHDPVRRAPRSFLLARIDDLAPTLERFTAPPDFDARRHLSGSLGRFTGPHLHTVRLRFDATAAPYVRERPWHPTQTLTELPDGGCETTLVLNNLVDIQRRVLANGRHVEVLAPAELRHALVAEIDAIGRVYASPTSVQTLVSTPATPRPAPRLRRPTRRGNAKSYSQGQPAPLPLG